MTTNRELYIKITGMYQMRSLPKEELWELMDEARKDAVDIVIKKIEDRFPEWELGFDLMQNDIRWKEFKKELRCGGKK